MWPGSRSTAERKSMMAYVDETERRRPRRSAVVGCPYRSASPTADRHQGSGAADRCLPWPDAERLFLRLLHTVRPVQYAKLFGVPGQAQAGSTPMPGYRWT